MGLGSEIRQKRNVRRHVLLSPKVICEHVAKTRHRNPPWIFHLLCVKEFVAQECLLFVIPWTGACQAPLSMGFSSQEYWSGLPFPSPGIFLTQGSLPLSYILFLSGPGGPKVLEAEKGRGIFLGVGGEAKRPEKAL